MTWLHKGEIVEEIDPKYQAFVYMITNLQTGRLYIGLKQTTFARTKQVKGKKKRIRVESDWRDYWSSSEELQKDVEALGAENFTREIIYYCKLKSHANYLEAREQMDRRVLENPELYYNGIINCRVSRNHIKNLELC
jgi:predicted GIY-YIG superfamily endonuclease